MDNQPASAASPPARPPAASRIDLVFNQVVARIEPVTRFGQATLTRLHGAERSSRAVARWSSDIALTTERKAGTGALPAGVVVAARASLDGDVEHAIAAGWAAMPERIDRWLAAHGHEILELAPSDCYAGPAAFGHQFACDGRGGQGKVTCGDCRGAGAYTCTVCGGGGEARCTSCSGHGTNACSGCGGGMRMVQRSRQVLNSSNNYQTEHYSAQEICASCGGGGRHACSICGGSGLRSCSQCHASGRERCSQCAGAGAVRCTKCAGSGQRHEIERVICTVAHKFEVVSADPSSVVGDRLATLSLAELTALGTVTVHPPARQPNNLERRYSVDVDIAELTVRVAGREIALTGFGREALVHDFQNLIVLLLEDDLHQLTSALSTGSGVSPVQPAALRNAVAQCLESEANIYVAAAKAQDPEYLTHLVQKQFAGAMSTEYALGLHVAIRAAVGRLYTSAMLVPGVVVVLLPPLIYLLLRGSNGDNGPAAVVRASRCWLAW
ncbi:MAG: hypothetical protein ABI542_05430 [Gemmatimonadota bacterium]